MFLNEAHVSKGVILSCAYLFGLPSLRLNSADLAAMTRRENEFTAAQVAQYPTRLVGFARAGGLVKAGRELGRTGHHGVAVVDGQLTRASTTTACTGAAFRGG